jgi:8-oxo-dGTP pyrophosphatase MutT (NUDIX family)
MSAGIAGRASLTDATLREPLRHLLMQRPRRTLSLNSTTAAAVLIPLFEKDGETHVWLVRRPASMRSHAGQIAFPGGKNDATDDSLLMTALRETEEELGIERKNVDVLGALDDTRTITGFTITPWVGWLAQDIQVLPNASEVERAMSPPLRTFFAPPTGVSPWRGWIVDGELVWGATAAIVNELVNLVQGLQ